MGLIITPKQQIDNYFDNEAVSQSRLKTLLGGLDSFLKDQEKSDKDLYYSEKSHFIKGSAVDIKLTGDEHDFENEYYISRLDTKPTDTEMSIAHRTFDYLIAEGVNPADMDTLVTYHGTLTQAVEDEKWYGGNPGEKRMATLTQNINMYFTELARSHGKQIISLEEIDVIDAVVDSFKTHSRTSKYFDREQLSRNSSADVYLQLPIYFEYQGVKCKALIDMLIVYKDDANNIVSVQPIDIKTMSGPTINFPFSMKNRRYDIQAAWYTLAITEWLSYKNHVSDVVIMNFKFLVESTTQPGCPLEFVLDESLFMMGKQGRPELVVNAAGVSDDFDTAHLHELRYNEVKGYETLFDDYVWYVLNGNLQEDRRITDNGGIFRLDWNGIM